MTKQNRRVLIIDDRPQIRGWLDRLLENEGYDVLFQAIQLQHTIFERTDYGNIEIGMDLVYFVDMGIVANDKGSSLQS